MKMAKSRYEKNLEEPYNFIFFLRFHFKKCYEDRGHHSWTHLGNELSFPETTLPLSSGIKDLVTGFVLVIDSPSDQGCMILARHVLSQYYPYFSLDELHFRYVSKRITLRDAQCHTTSNCARLEGPVGRFLGMACPDPCSSRAAAKCRCRKYLDSPWSWLVCFSATFIIVLTLGISLNFGVLFPVLMDYFQESRERIGKLKSSIGFNVYLCVKTCEVFLCFVAIVRVYYVDLFVSFVLRHW